MQRSATKNFDWKEFYCPEEKELRVSDLTLFHIGLLQKLREQFGNPLKVNSGYRSREHNRRVGGAKRSMHLEFATDIAPTKNNTMDVLDEIAGLAEDLGFSGIGRYKTFVHLDCRDFIARPPARWDHRSDDYKT